MKYVATLAVVAAVLLAGVVLFLYWKKSSDTGGPWASQTVSNTTMQNDTGSGGGLAGMAGMLPW